MARATEGQIAASISSVLPPRRISLLARELGVVKRAARDRWLCHESSLRGGEQLEVPGFDP